MSSPFWCGWSIHLSFAVADHFATFKLMPESTVQVVLHTGAKVKANPAAIETTPAVADLLARVRRRLEALHHVV